ncbi:hypothetical protein D918_06390 [Trichuris suis]|nr:hypothetical protein D918_06390 [Trichuris suis]
MNIQTFSSLTTPLKLDGVYLLGFRLRTLTVYRSPNQSVHAHLQSQAVKLFFDQRSYRLKQGRHIFEDPNFQVCNVSIVPPRKRFSVSLFGEGRPATRNIEAMLRQYRLYGFKTPRLT